MSENQSLIALDFDTLMCFVQGLIEVAKVDGIQPKEKEYIEAFLREELTYLSKKDEFIFEDLIKQNFDIEKAKELIKDNELKEYFLKSCVMLACVDTFSSEEKDLIIDFSNKLNYSQNDLNKIINEVQDEIMEHFKDISIYQDSLREVAKSIGVENF
jgi:hypothetical protein